MRALALIAFLISTMATSAHAKPMVAISACGDVVPRQSIGYLTGDLDCTGMHTTMGVVVLPGSELELRGFTITGGIFGVFCADLRDRPGSTPGFYSGGSCRIDGGGGSIIASEAHGIGGTRVAVVNLTIDGVGQQGVGADTKVRLENVTIANSGTEGLSAKGVLLINSTVTSSAKSGITARVTRLVGATVTGNGIGPTCGGIVYPDRCADLVTKKRPRLKNSECGSSLVPYSVHPAATWGVCLND